MGNSFGESHNADIFLANTGIGKKENPGSSVIGIVKNFSQGETLVSEDQPTRHCFRVMRGLVKEYFTMQDGHRQISGFFGPGAIVGLEANSARHQAVEAVSNCTVQVFPRSALTNASAEDASTAMVELLIDRLETAHRHLAMIARKSATERIAAFLLQIAEAEGRDSALKLTMNRQDMADHLGLTIETVCRTLTELKHKEVIAMPSARIFTIVDRRRLRAAAGCDHLT